MTSFFNKDDIFFFVWTGIFSIFFRLIGKKQMKKKSTRIPFEADHVYHLFNRGNNREKLFYVSDHYRLFLDLYKKYPGTMADTYSYCLIPNHFHFLIRVKMEVDGKDFVRQMRRWLISYAMTINRQIDRKGHLFTRPIKRIDVNDEYYLRNVIRYIHRNPYDHGVMRKWDNYPYSSYRDYISSLNNDIINRTEAMKFYNDDLLDFIDFHRALHDDLEITRYVIEEKDDISAPKR